MADYKVDGTHPVDLASGRMVEPGETIDLTRDEAEHPHNAALVDAGTLTSVKDLNAAAKAIDDEAAAAEAAAAAPEEEVK